MPDRVRLPRGTNEQLRAQGRRGDRSGRLVDALTYESMKGNVEKRLNFERRRLERLDRDLQSTFDRQRYHVKGLVEDLGVRLKEEKANLSDFFGEVGDVFQGEAGGFKESCGALYDAFREQASNINNLRKDLVRMLETEREIFKGFAEDWMELKDSAVGIFEDFKHVIEDPGDAVSDWLFGDQGDTFEPIFDDLFGQTPEVPTGGAPGGGGRPGRPPGPGSGGGPPSPGDVDVGTGRPRNPGGNSPGGSSPSGGTGREGLYQKRPAQGGGQSLRDAASQRQAVGDGGGKSLRDGVSRKQSTQGVNARNAAGRTKTMGREEALGRRHRVGQEQLSGSSSYGKGFSADQLGAQRAAGGVSSPAGAQEAIRGRGLASAQGAASGTPGIGDVSAGQGLSRVSGSTGGPGGVDLQGAASQGALGRAAGDVGSSSAHSAGISTSRAGALAPSDVASTVRPDEVSFLQSPSDGQLMMVPSDAAKPIDQAAFGSSVVDAQMAGNSQAAMAQTLSDSGYVVYERGTGDWFGEFVKSAANRAG
jgi:hypothetical protein